MSAKNRMLVKNVRLAESPDTAHDILIEDSRIVQIGVGLEAGSGAHVESGNGALALPGLVDAHCHLDKTLVGQPWHSHVPGSTVADRVRIDHELRRELGMPSIKNTSALVENIIAQGTTAVRTHTEIDSEVGLAGIEVINEVASRFSDSITIEQVAFPQSGILREPGIDSLLSEAVSLGAKIIGGIDPAGAERDPVGHLDRVFGLAVSTGASVDIHLHDPGDLGAWELDLICERTRVEGYSGKVNVSHAIALGQIDDKRQGQLIETMASSGVSMTTCILHNDPPPPVKRLVEGGVLLTAGNDSIRNTWSPFGTGDMLERAWLLAVRTGMRTDAHLKLILDIVSKNGHQLIDSERGPALEVGSIADFFLVDALNVGDAIARRPARTLVIRHGQISAQQSTISRPTV